MSLLKVNIENISINNSTRFEIIKRAKFDLKSNTIYSIFGSNGAGKTTLLLSLANLLNKNLISIKGEVIINSQNILGMNESDIFLLRQNFFQYIFQSPSASFDPLKKLNFYFNLVKNQKLFKSLLTESLLPDIDILGKKHIYEISEGQAQRLMVCIAIANEPKFLILDEPTSSLDILNIQILKKLLNNFLNPSNAILFVSHDKSFIKETAQQVAILKDSIVSEFFPVEQFT